MRIVPVHGQRDPIGKHHGKRRLQRRLDPIRKDLLVSHVRSRSLSGGRFASDDRWARPSGPRWVASRWKPGPSSPLISQPSWSRGVAGGSNCPIVQYRVPLLGVRICSRINYARQPAQGEEPMKKRKVWRKLIVSRFTIPLRSNFAVRGSGLLSLLALTGCEPGIFPSNGTVGAGNTTIMIDSLAIMLAIVVPTIAAVLAFAWWFRSSNSRARYRPDFVYSGQIEMVTWSIPLLTILLVGGVAWLGSPQFDPARPLPSDEPPLRVQVVSLDWKWLFIYPDHNIATVNRLVIPTGTPVHFTLTSSSVMNAFFIAKLGSMIYPMNRMAPQLNLNADQPGTFLGMSSHFSGDGFADMQFKVEALPKDKFSAWIDETRNAAAAPLTSQAYQDLAKPSTNVAPFAYSA